MEDPYKPVKENSIIISIILRKCFLSSLYPAEPPNGNPVFNYRLWLSGDFLMGPTGIVVLAMFGEDCFKNAFALTPRPLPKPHYIFT